MVENSLLLLPHNLARLSRYNLGLAAKTRDFARHAHLRIFIFRLRRSQLCTIAAQIRIVKTSFGYGSSRSNKSGLPFAGGCTVGADRFNNAIQKTYHRTPTQIRRIARRKVTLPENEYLFRLRFRPPHNWKEMLAFLGPRATRGVEEVTSDTYRRTISLNGCEGYFEISLDQNQIGSCG